MEFEWHFRKRRQIGIVGRFDRNGTSRDTIISIAFWVRRVNCKVVEMYHSLSNAFNAIGKA
ncbi:MAG: hypothetical protein H6Q69_3723 [Firmicutes bacterium]|nr:hypothetical protein [Bacillota bacterium]